MGHLEGLLRGQRNQIIPLIQVPPAPRWAPLYRTLRGYGVGGSGYSLRIIDMILEVNSLPKIFDSIRIIIVNRSCPPKKYFGPLIMGVRGVEVTYNWPHY